MAHLLFTYGTLRLPRVQESVFGRILYSEPDAVIGHVLGEVEITDPAVIATSGSAVHPVLMVSAAPDAAVEGSVLTLDDTDLAAADAYEVDAYHRISVTLRSGRTAWVYALAT
jgi:gamma-glutamylcyclotransferase (GGCT)/AIG2-like uncharacterized protein YtfP